MSTSDDNLPFISLGVICVVVLLLASYYENCRREIPVAWFRNTAPPRSTEDQRKQQLNQYFHRDDRRMKLTTENFSRNQHGFDIESADSTKKGDNNRDNDDGGITDIIHLKIPTEESERICSNCCAICLDPYKVEDVVVWSSSPDCRHVFHQECLVEGLSRAQDDDAPCPCCRMQFCDIQIERRQ